MTDENDGTGLRRLMNFGRFCGNSRLARLAARAEAKYPAGARELGDDEIGELFAAGDPGPSGSAGEDNDDC